MESKKKDTEGPEQNQGIWRATLNDDLILFKSVTRNTTEFDYKSIKNTNNSAKNLLTTTAIKFCESR